MTLYTDQNSYTLEIPREGYSGVDRFSFDRFSKEGALKVKRRKPRYRVTNAERACSVGH